MAFVFCRIIVPRYPTSRIPWHIPRYPTRIPWYVQVLTLAEPNAFVCGDHSMAFTKTPKQ